MTLVRLQLSAPEGRHTAGPVATITLANPPLNLVTRELLSDLHQALREVAVSEARAVIVCQGNSRVFCAGSDMREFEQVASAPAEQKILIENHALRELARLPVPTIAAIEGAALGGGLELALACDLRVAGRTATLGFPEVAIGGLASNGSQRATKIVGPARAKELILTGEPIAAATAERWGLINEMVDDGSAEDRAVAIATLIASRAPRSVQLSKELIDLAVDTPLDAGVVAGIAAQETIFACEDLYEGAAAFAERRQPHFRGPDHSAE